MVRNFRALQGFLEYRYPELRGRIYGSNYPPPQHAIIMVQLAQLMQWSAIALMMAGEKIFGMMGIGTPAWAKRIQENKMNTAFKIFLLPFSVHHYFLHEFDGTVHDGDWRIRGHSRRRGDIF